MMGASLPMSFTAQDAYTNTIGQVIENYTITAQTGTIAGLTSTAFNDFGNGNFLYQAPNKVTENLPITINISGTNQAGKLIT